MMEMLIFYGILAVLFIGVWTILKKCFLGVLWLWSKTYFSKRRQDKLKKRYKKLERMRTRAILNNSVAWKEEIDRLYSEVL